MKILADKVLTEIPDIDVSWIKNPNIPKRPDIPNTIMDRVMYQKQIAEELNKLVPCMKLIDNAQNVLNTVLSSNTDQQSKSIQKRLTEKVHEITEQAQEKVKEEIKKLPKSKVVT